MVEKTRYPGIFYDEKRKTYLVQTTFTTKDHLYIKKCKRGFKSLKDADIWKHSTASDYRIREYKEIISGKNKMGVLIDEYVEFKKLKFKPTTLAQTKQILCKYFLPFFDKAINKINVRDIADFYQSVAVMELKNNSKNVIINKVLGFIDYLDVMEYISVDLTRKFKRILQKFDISMISKKDSFLELDDYKLFINSFGFSKDELMYKLLFNILYFTGARIGEVLALRYSDLIDDEIYINKQVQYCKDKGVINNYECFNNYYILPYTKTNTNKIVKIPIWLVNDIIYYKGMDSINDKYIFFRNGSLVSRLSVRFILNKHLDMLGLDRIRIHDFRHSHITNLYDMGCDGKYVAERVGHSSEMTSRKVYQHLTKKKKNKYDDIVSKMGIEIVKN